MTALAALPLTRQAADGPFVRPLVMWILVGEVFSVKLPTGCWFPEPSGTDATYAARQEHTLDWLARSTVARAVDCRRFLNQNIAQLAVRHQSRMVEALRDRWQSAFFELVVARILQELGAAVSVEDTNAEGKRPDFRAEFTDGTVVVEATTPVFNAAVGEEAKSRIPLLSFIEANAPEGWSVGVSALPNIGLSDSRRLFQTTVLEMLSVPPPSGSDEIVELTRDLPSGTIRLHLLPRRPSKDRRLVWEAPLGSFDNSASRIAYAVKSKRRQVRGSREPVLLAIHASGLGSSLEDFDHALFGRRFTIVDHEWHALEEGFLPDGVFAKAGRSNPTYAGVLAFLRVGFSVCDGPVLYHHPRYTDTLPTSLLGLAQRRYDAQNGIISESPSRVPDLADALGLVRA